MPIAATVAANSMYVCWTLGMALEVASVWLGPEFWAAGVGMICAGAVGPAVALAIVSSKTITEKPNG